MLHICNPLPYCPSVKTINWKRSQSGCKQILHWMWGYKHHRLWFSASVAIVEVNQFGVERDGWACMFHKGPSEPLLQSSQRRSCSTCACLSRNGFCFLPFRALPATLSWLLSRLHQGVRCGSSLSTVGQFNPSVQLCLIHLISSPKWSFSYTSSVEFLVDSRNWVPFEFPFKGME